MISERFLIQTKLHLLSNLYFAKRVLKLPFIIHTVSDSGKITPGAMLNDDILVNTAEINQISVSAV